MFKPEYFRDAEHSNKLLITMKNN